MNTLTRVFGEFVLEHPELFVSGYAGITLLWVWAMREWWLSRNREWLFWAIVLGAVTLIPTILMLWVELVRRSGRI